MKRLLQALTLSSFTLLASNSNGAIVYNDITDATLASAGTINIDFNTDGTTEFAIEDQAFGGTVEPGVFFASANHGFVMLGDLQAGGWDEILGLTAGTTIDANSNFANNGADGYIDPFWANAPFGTGDQYIGAQFDLAGNIHFGWILVNWDANGTFIIKSFAYESVPNTAINAGDTGTGGGPVLVTSISVDGQGGVTTISTAAGTLQLSANVLPANADDNSITWSVQNGTGSASISTSGLLTAITDGSVTVVATANDASGVTGTLDISITNQAASLSEMTTSQVTVSPNPATNSITISSEDPISSVQIYAANGQLVKTIQTHSTEERIYIEQLKTGIYTLQVTTRNGLFIRRLSKH